MPRKVSLTLITILTVFLFSPSSTYAVLIPTQYRTDWQPGIPGDIPNYPDSTNVKDYDATGNGSTDDRSAILSAISAAPEGTAVYFPPGRYRISSSISIKKSIVIRGQGDVNDPNNRTEIICATSGNCFTVGGKSSYSGINLTQNAVKDQYTLTLTSTSNLSTGDYIDIRQANDPAVFTPGSSGIESWGDDSIGQVAKITSISGNTATIERPILYPYDTSQGARAHPLNMVERVGFENFYLDRTATDSYGRNIDLVQCAYCWVDKVWSHKTLSAHVRLIRTYQNQIQNSFFDSSHLHGSGGQGYGVILEERPTDTLIQNSIFDHLRHPMLLQMGAAANVFAYNYSRNSYTSQSPGWLSSDAIAHGHYPNLNLFEGNIIQTFEPDIVHGSNGPSTAYRNRIQRILSDYTYPISDPAKFPYIEIRRYNYYNNAINNELGYSGAPSVSTPIRVDSGVASTTNLKHNYIYQNNQLDRPTSESLPSSLYLNSKPSYFGNMTWPPYGGDIAPNNNSIPAKQRFDSSQYISYSTSSTPPPTNSPTPTPTPTQSPTNPPSASPTSSPSTGYTYQAEDQILSDSLVETEHSGFTGTGYVNFASASNSSINWTNISVPSAGTYPVTFRYAIGPSSYPTRIVSLSLNGSSYADLTFTTTNAWDAWTDKTLNLPLQAGSNTIQVTTTGQDGPNLDYLSLVIDNPNSCPADINQDGFIDLTDFSILSANFLSTSPSNPRADIYPDGIVDLTDFSILSQNFFQSCP